MKRYTIIHPLILSFFSKSLYQDVGRNWNGLCLGYLLFLLALCQVPIMMKLHRFISEFTGKEAREIVNQIPEIVISDGKVSLQEPQPYFIKDPQKGTPLFVIDTTGKITSLEDTDAYALLTETKLVYHQSPTETRIHDLSLIEDFFLNQERLNNWLDLFKKWAPVVIYPFAVIFSFLFRLIQVLIYGVTGILFTRTLHASADYQTLVRLAVIAITPAVIIDTYLTAAAIPVPLGWFFGFLITMGYLFYAVKVNLEPEPADKLI